MIASLEYLQSNTHGLIHEGGGGVHCIVHIILCDTSAQPAHHTLSSEFYFFVNIVVGMSYL